MTEGEMKPLEEFIPIRPYPKYILAELFNNTQRTEFRLRLQIKNNRFLEEKLEAIKYKKSKQHLQIKEVELIFEYIRRPKLTRKNREILASITYD